MRTKEEILQRIDELQEIVDTQQYAKDKPVGTYKVVISHLNWVLGRYFQD